MKFESFLSSKIFTHKRYKKSISSPIIKISTLSISISIIVMIIAISTGFGIQNEIKSKFSNVFGDLSIDRYDNDLYNSENYIESDAINVNSIKSMENLKSIDPVIYSPVISPNNNSFDDIILKGINEDNYIFKTKLLSNKINNIGVNEVIISKKLSKKLELQLKDNLMVFYYQNQSLPKIRNLKVIGFYETAISEFDSKVVLTNINQLRSLKNINNNQIGSYELHFYDYKKIDLENLEKYVPPNYALNFNNEKFSEIYNWVSLFDLNVYLIIVLMIVIGAINMITALLVTILEKTSLIGFLKIIGSNNNSIERIFLNNGLSLIFKGLVWGNLISIIIIFVQKFFQVFKLNADTYYIDYVPVEINLIQILLLNLITIFICYVFLIIPVKIISKIKPYSSLRMN